MHAPASSIDPAERGFEPETAAARLAEARLDRVIASPFPDRHLLPDLPLDWVVGNDVLEPLPPPEEARPGGAPPAPGGAAVASIPEVRHLPTPRRLVAGGEWEYMERGILDKTHARFFTRGSIRARFAGNGYRVEALDGVDPCRLMTPADREPRRGLRHCRRLPLPRVYDMTFLRVAVRATTGQEPAPQARRFRRNLSQSTAIVATAVRRAAPWRHVNSSLSRFPLPGRRYRSAPHE
jgi:hypothetical protein